MIDKFYTMQKWVRVRYGLTFQEPKDLIKYVDTLKNQDPQNRQAALAMVLAWINLQLGSTMNRYAKDEKASEKTATELENVITYLAQGWSKNILDFSEKVLPVVEGQTTTPAPAPAVAQGAKRIKTTYSQPKKPVTCKDIKRRLMMSGRMKL